MTDFDSVTLGPDDFLLLRPRPDFPAEWLTAVMQSIPERLRGRVLVVDPTAFDVVHVRSLRQAS